MKAETKEHLVTNLRRFKPYPAYKDSGVEWLGKIPARWTCNRLRYVAHLNPIKSEVRGLDPQLSVSFVPMEAVGEYGGLTLDVVKPLEACLAGYTSFRDGDVVVAKITPCFENGKGAIAAGLENGIGFGTTELHVLRAARGIDFRFLFYLTISDHFRRLGAATMYGAGGQKRVPEDFIQNLKHPLPSESEQRLISAFLDRETAIIDALVEKKKQLIELLEEKRSALITQAVTKGINSNAPLKESGIEWLREIPAHWDVKSLKRISRRVDVGIAEAATHAYADEGVPIIRTTNVRANRLLTDDLLRIEPWFAEKSRSKYLFAGDLVTVRTGVPGTTAVVPQELDRSQCFTMLISTPKDDQVSEFLSYFLNSTSAQVYFGLEGWGTAQTNISVPILQEIPIPVPPTDEQNAIVAYIGANVARIADLLKSMHAAIDRLKELRTALISAAVTGKIDVREDVV